MRRISTTILIVISIFGCSTRYAMVAIDVVDAKDNSQVSGTKVYSGKDGLFIGNTPALNYIITNNNRKEVYMSLIVEADHYQTKMQIIEVSKWAKTIVDAHDASRINRVLFVLTPTTCP